MACDLRHSASLAPVTFFGPGDHLHFGRMADRLRSGRGIIVGSGDNALPFVYVAGGRITDWSLLRRATSRGGCWYARTVLGLDVRDLTGGFKCFATEVLDAIDAASVHSRGYAFQIELTYRALRAGFRVQEVPITFRDRRRGSSKMSWRIALEAAWLVPQLRRDAGRPRKLRAVPRAAGRRVGTRRRRRRSSGPGAHRGGSTSGGPVSGPSGRLSS